MVAALLIARLPVMGMAKVNYSRYKVFRIRPESGKREWLAEKLEKLGGECKINFVNERHHTMALCFGARRATIHCPSYILRIEPRTAPSTSALPSSTTMLALLSMLQLTIVTLDFPGKGI